MIKKYKVHEVAKDFDIPSKFIIEKVSQYFESEKKSQTALEEKELDFIFFIEKVRYMFPKHHAIVCLKYAIVFMWYKIHHKSEFDAIIGGK